jgi:uncharacterized protein YjbJ (UPF0337 family)
MTTADKFKNKAEEIEGQIKEKAGQAKDDPKLTGEGKAKQVTGNLKQAGEKVKDAVR